jgi:hypothetical protein
VLRLGSSHMLEKLNDYIGIALLVIVLGGGSVYGLYKFMSGPPLLRQSGDEVDPRTNWYAQEIMRSHEKVMREIQQRQEDTFQDAIDIGRSVTGS